MAIKENLTRFIQAIQEDSNYDIEEIKDMVNESSEHDIRGAAKQFIQLCHLITEILVKTKRSVSGISLLSTMISKFQQHRSQLTPFHSDFCLLCLDAKCFNPALEFLDIDYTEIKTTDVAADDVKQVLSFYYYGGLIYAAVKNFERASHYFEIVLTIPANVITPIMQETYKKFILVNVLLNGKLPDHILPKYTSQCVIRQRKQICHSYLKFAQEYSSLNIERIRQVVSMNTGIFERDENMGLIKQCLTQVHRRNILRLTKTFLTLPLSEVANYVGLHSDKEAELYILNMIDDGEISATINQRDGMVVFQDINEKYDSVKVFQELQESMALTTTLIETLKKMNPEALIEHKTNLCKSVSSDLL